MAEIVAYCEVGVRASLFALLHEAYTGRLVSVFDGSAVEWALNSGLALKTGTTS
jgi:3-mercaptopyruvate sulfurtransferase SseA